MKNAIAMAATEPITAITIPATAPELTPDAAATLAATAVDEAVGNPALPAIAVLPAVV